MEEQMHHSYGTIPSTVPRVRGVLGIHVDDGIVGCDSFFQATIQRLKEKYSLEHTMKGSLICTESTSKKGKTVP